MNTCVQTHYITLSALKNTSTQKDRSEQVSQNNVKRTVKTTVSFPDLHKLLKSRRYRLCILTSGSPTEQPEIEGLKQSFVHTHRNYAQYLHR